MNHALLLCNQQIIVLFAALNKQIFLVEQVSSCLLYTSQTIEVPARHNMMEIRLRPNVNELDEVVVQVAYGTVLKRSITGAV